jgi:hypothetical protein
MFSKEESMLKNSQEFSAYDCERDSIGNLVKLNVILQILANLKKI